MEGVEMEPFTLGAIGAVVLAEGIKFLYNQAGEVLKRRREHREAAATGTPTAETVPIETTPPPIFEGELAPAKIDFDATERLEQDLKDLRKSLVDYADDIEPVDPKNENLLKVVDALRQAMEAIYHQRLTFKGEQRPSSGPIVEGRIDVEEVAGYVAAVRADVIESGRSTGVTDVERVEEGGEAIGVDVKRIGGR